MKKMTVAQLADGIIENRKSMIEIGSQKKRNGVPNEILQNRVRSFKDVLDWYNRGCSFRRKEEMEHLYKRSQRMVENFNRL